MIRAVFFRSGGLRGFELIDAAHIRHRHVLIIDDVVTTGATTSALADKLSQAGDVRISVFSIAIAKQHH